MASHNFHLATDGSKYVCRGCGAEVPMVKHGTAGKHIQGDSTPASEIHQDVSRFPTTDCPGGK